MLAGYRELSFAVTLIVSYRASPKGLRIRSIFARNHEQILRRSRPSHCPVPRQPHLGTGPKRVVTTNNAQEDVALEWQCREVLGWHASET